MNPSPISHLQSAVQSAPKIFLALPVYGGYDPHFVTSLLRFVTHQPRVADLIIRPCIGDSLVARARNRLCAEFLATAATHLLFMDTDLIFSPEHIAKLVSHAQRGEPLVAGLYPKKQLELGWVCNVLDELQEVNEHGLVEVKYAGTGCLMIAREVLTAMIAKYPAIEYDPDEGDSPGVKWDFFATGVQAFQERRRYLSEDWMFCQRAQESGFRVMMDTSVVLKHVGQFIYPVQDIEAQAATFDTTLTT